MTETVIKNTEPTQTTSSSATVVNEHILTIGDMDNEVRVSYLQCLESYDGDALWGLTCAFRMLQLAQQLLSGENLWQRQKLYTVSAHPGPGVRYCVEYVTHCDSAGRYCLLPACENQNGCTRDMQYTWWLSDDQKTVRISLRNHFIPDSFFTLLDQVNNEQLDAAEKATIRHAFNAAKQSLAKSIWQYPVHEIFACSIRNEYLAPGKLPAAT